MATDWIKMRTNLWHDPRVGCVVDRTDSSEATVIGGLYWLWAVADEHTQDGWLPNMSPRQIDRQVGLPGFAAALAHIGWIEVEAGGIRIIRFDDHNGKSAKTRAQTARRVAKHEERKLNGELTPEASTTNAGSVSESIGRRYQEQEQEQDPPDSFSEGTRDARPPAEPDIAGTFEGHDDPHTGPPNPAVPFAVALNAAGVRCTALNPDLAAYVAEGGTVEHLLAIAQQCPGKPVRYVASFARRELADRAAEVTATANAPPHNGATSKSVQALTALEALKSHDALDPHRDRHRLAEAAPALAGPHPVR